jgi:hypothetical protein
MPESILVAIVETGVFTEFTYPRKQQKKVGLQKGIENAAEPFCCLVLKGSRQMLFCLCSYHMLYIFHTSSNEKKSAQ